MIVAMQSFIPAEWRGAFEFLAAPIAWVPDWHIMMMNFAWYGDSFTEGLLKRVFVLLPMLLVIVAVWSTMASLYTLPFRSGRGGFLTALLLSWWDAMRSIWFFWAGLARLAVLLVGWLWASIRLGFRLLGAGIKGTFKSPLMLIDWTSRNYFKPGVPWVAFLALMFWCVVEAIVFMFTLSPTLTEVLAGITGFEPNPRIMAPILWVFLYFLILGSFACIQVLTEAIRARKAGEIVQMVFVELFVMFFEVIFLYRELVDAIAPWIAQQTSEGVQLGLVSTLLLASFGWIGVRGMTWFLFGRFGTPALLAVLARDTISREEPLTATPMPPQPEIWRGPITELKAEVEWFKKESRHLYELLSVPLLQLLAAAVNFLVVVISSRPYFRLPFKNLDEVLAQTPRWPKTRQGGPVPSPEPVAQGGAR